MLAVILSLSACSTSPGASPSQEASSGTASANGGTVSVGFLKGPTGMGAAYFMEQADSGVYGDTYRITLDSDPSATAGALVSGEYDIACLPTNVAASLYNKTGGKIRIAAINTLGVLYILEKGESIRSVSDLEGKTVYATGQGANPEYVLNYILSGNGLTPGENITVEYLASDELAARAAGGEIDICMLPIPAATPVLIKNPEMREALDLNEEWNAVSGDGSILTQGCIAFGESVTDEQLSAFIDACRISVEYMTDENNLDDAAALCEKHGIVGAAAIAKAAIPKCGMVLIDGADNMRAYLTGYFFVLYSADAASIGGSVPDDRFYREA